MRTTQFPGTALAPSVLCLGTGGFGSVNPLDASLAMLDAYAAAGGNFIDTAHAYAEGIPGGKGASETTIGRWLKGHGRAGMLIATKGGQPDPQPPHKPRLRPEQLILDLEISLDRLGLESVDLYWLHRDNPDIPVDELLGVTNDLLGRGWLHAIGASNWQPDRLRAASAYAARAGAQGFCASQISWNLAHLNEPAREPGLEYMQDPAMRAYHAETGLPAVGYNAQAQGFFGPQHDWQSAPPATPRAQSVARLYLNETSLARLDRAQTLAARRRCTANAIAIAWLTSHPFPSVAIIGPQSAAQLNSSLEAADLHLTPDEMDNLTPTNEKT